MLVKYVVKNAAYAEENRDLYAVIMGEAGGRMHIHIPF